MSPSSDIFIHNTSEEAFHRLPAAVTFHLLLLQVFFLTHPFLPWLHSLSSEHKHKTSSSSSSSSSSPTSMDPVSMDVLCFEDDNNHSSSSSGSLPQKPFSGYWSSFSSMDDNYVAEICHEEVVDRVELGDTDLLKSSAVEIQEQLNELDVLMDSMDSTCQVSGDSFQQCQKGNFHQSNFFLHSLLHIPNEQSQPTSNKSCSFDASSSNYMMIDQQMLPTSKAKQQSFSLATMEEMVLTRAMLRVISASPSSSSSSSSATTSYQKAQTYQTQANYCPPMSSFQPYSSSKPPTKESQKNLHGQNMIKKAHNMLRSVNMLKDEGKMEEAPPSAYQMQHMVSERRRRERLNASFHSLWQLLPPGSKKDKTSVLCKTVSYVKTLKDEIYELEEKNRILEENLLRNIDVKEKSKPNERVEVQINKSSEKTTSEIEQIELVIMVRVQCDLIRVVLHVLECIRAMKAISLLSFDTIPNSQQMKLLATLKLTIEGSTWDERTFKEAITGAAHMALAMTT